MDNEEKSEGAEDSGSMYRTSMDSPNLENLSDVTQAITKLNRLPAIIDIANATEKGKTVGGQNTAETAPKSQPAPKKEEPWQKEMREKLAQFKAERQQLDQPPQEPSK